MTAYRNSTKGARAIHLTNGTYVLVEPGATAEVADGKIKRMAPGFTKAPNDVPEVPEDLAARLRDGEQPEVSMALKKDELVAIAEAEGVEHESDDNKADLIRKIEAKRQ